MKTRIISLLFVGILICLTLTTQGCILVPFIESFKSVGAMQSDRENLLRERLTYFHRARFWGEPEQAMAFLMPEARANLGHIFRSRDDEKIVETKVKGILFDEEAYIADVKANVRFFKTSYNVVENRIENQKWSFTLANGWRLQSLEYQ